MNKLALVIVFLAGCNVVNGESEDGGAIVTDGAQSADVQQIDVSVSNGQDSGEDSSVSEDANMVSSKDSSVSEETGDGGYLDTGIDAPITPADAGLDSTVAPVVDETNGIYCNTSAGLFVGCNGQSETYSITTNADPTKYTTSCGVGTDALATCPKGTACEVDNGGVFYGGTCQ